LKQATNNRIHLPSSPPPTPFLPYQGALLVLKGTFQFVLECKFCAPKTLEQEGEKTYLEKVVADGPLPLHPLVVVWIGLDWIG